MLKLFLSICYTVLCLSISWSQSSEYKDYIDNDFYKYVVKLEDSISGSNACLEKTEMYLTLGTKSMNKNGYLSMAYCKKGIEMASSCNEDYLRNRLYMIQVYNYASKGIVDTSAIYVAKILPYFTEYGDTTMLVKSYIAASWHENRKGDFSMSNAYLIKAKQLLENNKNSRFYANVLNRLGINYNQMDDYYKAIIYYEEIIHNVEELGFEPHFYSTAISNITTAYKNTGQVERSMMYLKKSIDLYRGTKDYGNLAKLYKLLTTTHLENKDTTHAIVYLDSSIYILKKTARYGELGSAQLRKWALENESDDQLLLSGYNNALKISDVSKHQYAYRSKIKYHESRREYEEAFKIQSKLVALNDSINSAEEKEKIRKLEDQLIRRESDNIITSLEKEKTTATLSLDKSNKRLIFLGGVLAILSLLTFLLWKMAKERKTNNLLLGKKNEQINKALKEKDVLLREIHHRVKNNLQLVSSLLTLQSRNIEDAAALEAIKIGKSRVKSMSLIHQDLYRDENSTGVNVHSYLHKLATELFRTYNVTSDNITLHIQVDDIELDVDTVVPLGLIINELITNSLKYACKENEKGQLNISLNEKGKVLQLIVSDNGKGVASIDSSSSFGNKLIKILTQQLNGEIRVDGSDGTTIIIDINDYKRIA